MTPIGRVGRATRRGKLGSLTPKGRLGSTTPRGRLGSVTFWGGQRDLLAIDISDLCAFGLVLAVLDALRVVESGAATVETYKYCVPLENLGKRRCWADVLPRHLP